MLFNKLCSWLNIVNEFFIKKRSLHPSVSIFSYIFYEYLDGSNVFCSNRER